MPCVLRSMLMTVTTSFDRVWPVALRWSGILLKAIVISVAIVYLAGLAPPEWGLHPGFAE